jgi:alpha-glucosidase
MNALRRWMLLFALFSCSSALFAQPKPKVDAEGHAWWQHAVFYEIYPRSFADSNNDGTGDLKGITSKLAYLHQLGVDAIWLTPCYPSPQVDFGYDVSDYENIDPQYGTLADFDAMAAEGKKERVRIIMDFVMNHSSDQHPWFIDSKSSKTSAKRDWYIWRDGKGAGQPPNNWTSIFAGPAWTIDPATNQYYYHFFYKEQPDLNWRNPAVKQAMFDVPRFWFKRGVAGFRLDAVDTLFEDPQLRDNPEKKDEKNAYGDPVQERTYNDNLPEVHDVLRELRKVADESDAVLIGETWTKDIEGLKKYYGQGNELHMPMDFLFTMVNKLSAPEFRKQIAGADASGWPVFVLSNHDIRRHYERYGDGKHNDQIAKLMAGLYLTLRGTPIMYYGEEIGMQNNDPKSKGDVKDPIGKSGWPQEKGRDGERTPMQWNTAPNAGFSTVEPWLPVPAAYKTHNVASEEKDPASILNFYRHLLRLRHTNPALREGRYVPLDEQNPSVLSYLRVYKGSAVLVVLNMSGTEQKVSLQLKGTGAPAAATWNPLLAAPAMKTARVTPRAITVPPFGVIIASPPSGAAAHRKPTGQ